MRTRRREHIVGLHDRQSWRGFLVSFQKRNIPESTSCPRCFSLGVPGSSHRVDHHTTAHPSPIIRQNGAANSPPLFFLMTGDSLVFSEAIKKNLYIFLISRGGSLGSISWREGCVGYVRAAPVCLRDRVPLLGLQLSLSPVPELSQRFSQLFECILDLKLWCVC